MDYKKLGTTDIEVSKICLGTMTFGEQNSEAEGHEQMDYALEQGVNFFDTAEMYSVPSSAKTQGSTERIIGTWFKKTGNRDKVVLATKITGPSPGLSFLRDPLNFSPEQLDIAIEGSLKRLQTDHVDLYQLHWPERKVNMFGVRNYPYHSEDQWEDNFLTILEKMQSLIKEGKIRHFGVSNETPWGVMNFVKLAEKHNLPRPMSIQNPYSLLNRIFDVGLAEVAMREKVGLLAYSPMGFGMLSGKYHKKTDTPESRINKFKAYSRYSSQNSWDATTKYLELAESNGMTLAEMSLAFINDLPFVTANIIGATTMEQLKENIGSADVTLSKEVLKAINEIQEQYPNSAP